MTTAIPYTQCNTCHNRGNYDLQDMQFHAGQDHPTNRLEDYYQPMAQFTQCELKLDCVDCHTSQEVMGDGDLHSYQIEVEYVRCYTCHGTLDSQPATLALPARNRPQLNSTSVPQINFPPELAEPCRKPKRFYSMGPEGWSPSARYVRPHLGCRVNDESNGFTCPCHGSQFDATGKLTRGPAKKDLRKLRLEVSERGSLILYTN